MNLYIASSFQNIPEVRELRDLLTMAGHRITHDWTLSEASVSGFVEGTPEWDAFLLECGREDFAGVLAADALVLIGHELCRDAMAEMGMALGAGRAVFVLHAERRRSVFYGCPRVQLVPDSTALLVALLEAEQARGPCRRIS